MSEQLALFIDFENIAIWAEQEFFDLDLTRLMEYLRGRGAVVIKRAYADWTRFPPYRNDMLNNSIDLIQLYSVRAGKNRADIRLALDAFETAMIRPQVRTIVIISGDSDFGALASRLRECGKYVLGIGPRAITHPLLVRSCDEFVYLETVFGSGVEPIDGSVSEREEARQLLLRALAAHGQRGELPVLAAKLKQTMLSMDSAFNEANLGYGQFRGWLEDNDDIVRLFFKDLQLYVAPTDFATPGSFELSRQSEGVGKRDGASLPQPDLATAYRKLFNKIVSADRETRRDILRDIYRELRERPGHWTASTLLDELQARYEARGLTRSKTTLLKIWQMGFRQRAYHYLGETISFSAPAELAEEIDSEATFILRAESRFVYAVLEAGLRVDPEELAAALLNDRTQVEYIQALLDDLVQRGHAVRSGNDYRLPGRSPAHLLSSNPALQVLLRDIENVQLPNGLSADSTKAHSYARKAMMQRSHDFSAAAHSYLVACRLQWEAVEQREANVGIEELRWYMASYASVKAGEMSQVHRDYAAAQPYYLAFFHLAQEDDPLWERMRGLINPMLYYYWVNVGRELGAQFEPTNSAARIAVAVATHPNSQLHERWLQVTRELAQINPNVLRWIVNQLRLTLSDEPESAQVAKQIEEMLRNQAFSTRLAET